MWIQTSCAALHRAIAIAVFTLVALPLTSHAAAGDPLGPEVRVDSDAGRYVADPAIARDGVGNLVVVWERMDFPASSIHARRYSASGEPLGAEFEVPLAGGTPSVAMDASGNFVVLASNYDIATKRSRVQFQRYAADGSARGAATEVTSVVGDLASYATLRVGTGLLATIAMAADGDFVVVWSRVTGASYGSAFTLVSASADATAVYARRYHADGTANGAAILVHADLPDIDVAGSTGPTVAMDANGGFVTAWLNQDLYRSNVEYKRYNANGRARSLMKHANPSSIQVPHSAAVAADPTGAFTIAWVDSDGSSGAPAYVRAQPYSNTGAAQSGPIVVNAGNTDSARSAVVGMQPGGGFIVAWIRYDDSIGGAALDAQRYAADRSAQGGNFRVNSIVPVSLRTPAVAVDGYGDFAIAWVQSTSGGTSDSGIYLRLYQGN